ncbi:MAG TPA: protein translocase subunit SecF [Verrucomicrobiae bacterium]|nr:protein translocase subunit SecF [Verrucomicrobiae bacterium]
MEKRAFNIIGNRKTWYIVSTLLIIPGIISLFVWGLNVGIDFKGGTLQQLSFVGDRPSADTIREDIAKAGIHGATIQTSGDKDVIIRFPNAEGKTPREEGTKLVDTFTSNGQEVTEQSFQNIGGSVAKDTTRKAVTAVILAALAIVAFIAYSFRSVPRPTSSWRFAVTTIFALAHDILFTVGAFSIIGHFFPTIEVDALFITALLTILGFSVNDTIVVFDRIRENLRRTPTKPFEEIANSSLNQTLARSLNTSMTVLIVLVSLLLLGGESIRNFILALTLGIAVGTYSSIFNAAPILVSWQNWVNKNALTPLKRR